MENKIFYTLYISTIVFVLAIFVYRSDIFPESGNAGGFGISPPYLMVDHLNPGDEFMQSITILRGDSEEEKKINISVYNPDVRNWVAYPDNLFFRKGETKKSINFKLLIPANAYNGDYKGKIMITIEEARPQNGVGINLGAVADVKFVIIGGKERPLVIKKTDPEYQEIINLWNKYKGFFIADTNKEIIYYANPATTSFEKIVDNDTALAVIKTYGIGIVNYDLRGIQEAGGAPIVVNDKLVNRLLGMFLVQVENKGAIWYISPSDKLRHSLGNRDVFFSNIKAMSLSLPGYELNYLAN